MTHDRSQAASTDDGHHPDTFDLPLHSFRAADPHLFVTRITRAQHRVLQALFDDRVQPYHPRYDGYVIAASAGQISHASRYLRKRRIVHSIVADITWPPGE